MGLYIVLNEALVCNIMRVLKQIPVQLVHTYYIHTYSIRPVVWVLRRRFLLCNFSCMANRCAHTLETYLTQAIFFRLLQPFVVWAIITWLAIIKLLQMKPLRLFHNYFLGPIKGNWFRWKRHSLNGCSGMQWLCCASHELFFFLSWFFLNSPQFITIVVEVKKQQKFLPNLRCNSALASWKHTKPKCIKFYVWFFLYIFSNGLTHWLRRGLIDYPM